jgi:hypothetical protein
MTELRLAIAALVACGSKDPPAPPPRDLRAECGRVAAHMEQLDTTKSTAANVTHPALKKSVIDAQTKRRSWLAERCIADSWPEDMIACMTSATAFADTERCTPLLDKVLTPAQIKALNDGYTAIETAAVADLRTLVEHELADMIALRDRICACSDAACRRAAGTLPTSPDDPILRSAYDQLATEIATCLAR